MFAMFVYHTLLHTFMCCKAWPTMLVIPRHIPAIILCSNATQSSVSYAGNVSLSYSIVHFLHCKVQLTTLVIPRHSTVSQSPGYHANTPTMLQRELKSSQLHQQIFCLLYFFCITKSRQPHWQSMHACLLFKSHTLFTNLAFWRKSLE